MGAGVETRTVLFTDLAGSTQQRVVLGDRAADLLRGRVDRVTVGVVRSHRGTVVKHTGDGVMATFDGASDALAAACAIQQAIADDNRARRRLDDAAAEMLVRIGISAGDVAVEGDDCFGLPVVEAQRLEAAAAPAQVLVSALVAALARGRSDVELRPVGALTLKGLDRPLEALEVVWSAARGGASLPSALLDRSGVPFAGRAAELEEAFAAWRDAVAGATRTLLVAGEPGIGKTRLLGELAARAAADGGVVLVGRCDEHVRVPYQPFVEALAPLIRRQGVLDRLGDDAGELARILPSVEALRPGLRPRLAATVDAERVALFDAVRALLTATTSDDPLLLVVDDAHWSDTESLLLLRHVAATHPVPRLLVAVTYRDTDVTSSHPVAGVLADLRRRSDVTRLHLRGLEQEDVAGIMAAAGVARMGGAPDAAAVHADTGGNPFFVGEVVRHLVSTDAATGSDRGPGDPHHPGVLPEGIRDVVGRRLALLGESSQRALRDASVIGTRFSLELVAAVTGTDEDELVDAFEPALAAHLLLEQGIGSYQFAHALVRSTLYSEISTTKRARLHEKVAVAIERLHGDSSSAVVPDLAHHWSQAGGAEAHARAIRFARRAAEVAYEQSAPDEAARWYRQARELLDGEDPALDARLLYQQGEAEAMAAAPGWQQTLLAAARAAEGLGDFGLMADALVIDQRFTLIRLADDPIAPEKVALLRRAHARLDDPVRRVHVAAALAKEEVILGDSAAAMALMAEVRAFADSRPDRLEQSRFRQLTMAMWDAMDQTRSQVEDTWRLMTEALPLARARGEPSDVSITLHGLFYVGLRSGRPNRHEVIAQLEEFVAQYPHPTAGDYLLNLRTMAALVDGDLAAAESWSRNVDQRWIAHGRDQDARVRRDGAIAQLLRERVGFASLADLLPRQPGFDADVGSPTGRSGVYATALADAGRLDDLRRLVDELATNDFSDLPRDASRPVAAAFWADAVAAARHQRGCKALHDHFAPLHDTHMTTGGWYLGASSHYLALLAAAMDRADDAEDWFSRAAAAHEAVASPTWLARTLVHWAEQRLGRADGSGARAIAARAVEVIGARELHASRARAERILAA